MQRLSVALVLVSFVCAGSLHAQHLEQRPLVSALTSTSERQVSHGWLAGLDSSSKVQSAGLSARRGAAYGALGLAVLAGAVTYVAITPGCDATSSGGCSASKTRISLALPAAALGAAIGAAGGAVVVGVWNKAHGRPPAKQP